MKLVKLSLATLCFFVIKAQERSSSCSLLINPYGFSTILLHNEAVYVGWFEVVNNTSYPVRLVNKKKPQYSFTLAPFERKSFNFKGVQEVACYKPNTEVSTDRSSDVQINCIDAVAITKCYNYSEEERNPELALVG